MGPIKISSLPKYIIDLILANQEKYNFNNSSEDEKLSLDEEEISILLKDLNKKDISELYNVGLDIFEAETPKTTGKEKTDNTNIKTEQAATEDDVLTNIAKRDTAGEMLKSMDATDIALDGESAFSQMYEAADDNSTLKYFIENCAREFMVTENKSSENTMSAKNIKYNVGGTEKEFTLKQSLSIGGIFNKEKNNNNEGDEGTSSETNDEAKTENNLDGGIHYNALFTSDNFNLKFKAHIDNTNQDFLLQFTNDKVLQNGGNLKYTGSGRMTLDQNEFYSSGGLALDYEKNGTTAGMLGHFDYYSSPAEQTVDYDAEAYVNFKGIGGLAAGVNGYSKDFSMMYVEGNLYGNTKLNNGMTLSGAVSGKLQKARINIEDMKCNFMDATVTLRGSLTFKGSEDFNANVDTMIVYDYLSEVGVDEKPEQDLGIVLRGGFRKGDTEVYTMGCLYKDLTEGDLVNGVATFGIQQYNLFGTGLIGYAEGTVCNTNSNPNPNSSISGVKTGVRLNF